MSTKKITYASAIIAIGILLPFSFHTFIPTLQLGPKLLPIHYASFLAGGFFGPIVGLIVGMITPILSFFTTGMPKFPAVIFMTIEIMIYGSVFGYLYFRSKLNIYFSLIVSMIIGRIAYISSVYFIGDLIMGNGFKFIIIFEGLTVGLLGIALQIIIIPIVIKRINIVFSFNNSNKKYFEFLKPDKTCILINDGKIIYDSKENSVKPLVKFIYYNGIPKENTILIDKIIGVAIGNVALYCNFNTVYAKIISKPALTLLENNNVAVFYEEIVDNILRKDKTDICPMEKKILTASSPQEAYDILKQIVIDDLPIHLN